MANNRFNDDVEIPEDVAILLGEDSKIVHDSGSGSTLITNLAGTVGFGFNPTAGVAGIIGEQFYAGFSPLRWPIDLPALAGGWLPRSAAGAGAPAPVTYNSSNSANYSEMTGYAFGDSANQYIHTSFIVPPDYDGRGLAFALHWATLTGGTASQVCRWTIWLKTAFGDGDSLDVVAADSGAQRVINDTYQGAKIMHIATGNTTATTGITLTPGKLCIVQVRRNAADVADTMDTTAYFHGLRISLQ